MAGFHRMIDMARSPEEVKKDMAPMAMSSPEMSGPVYPYGLCLNLCNEQLDKLDIDTADVQVGDIIHFMAMARVTSINESMQQTTGGEREPCCRIELQIEQMGHLEDEDNEGAEDHRERAKRRYGGEEKTEKPDDGGEMHLGKGDYKAK